jgi:hypothetical protein
MTFQAQNIEAITDYFWNVFPTTTSAAEIRRRAISYLYGLGWFSKNFSRAAFANAQNLQRQFRLANVR